MFYRFRGKEGTDDLHRQEIADIISPLLRYSASYNNMEVPYSILFETFHPAEATGTFIYSVAAPNDSIYSVLDYNEAMPILKNRMLHQHSYYELLYVLEGELYQIIESRRHIYPTGSCCLLNLNVRHTEEFSTNFRAIFLELSQDFLLDLFSKDQALYFEEEQHREDSRIQAFFEHYTDSDTENEKAYIDFIPRNGTAETQETMHKIFSKIYETTISPNAGSTFIIKYLVLQLFSMLEKDEYYQTTPIQLGTEAEALLFNQISKIMARTNGRTTRSQLEQQLNYSGDYLNKIVKKYTGLSIFNYGMSFCMREATRMLLHSSDSIAQIAAALGFKNRAHFYKIFGKTYGMTPKEYRERGQTAITGENI